MIWHSPWMLALAALATLVWWRWLRRQPHAAVRFSSTEWLRRQGATLRAKARHLLPVLRTLAVVLLAICLARPQKGNEETRIFSEGIAIQLVVDRSSSMLAMDFALEGRRVDRLAAVKRVIRDFIIGGEGLAGRPDDLIGLISFAGYADSVCPLTLDHAFLMETVDQTQIVSPEEGREEDGTAIGEGLALAVERLRDLDRRPGVAEANKVKSKIIILLTDGENNRGDIKPEKAAEIAKAFGLKVYTIGAGTTGVAPMPVKDLFGGTVMQSVRVSVDEESLQQIAEATGGKFFRATDTESLREIYAEIDQLEKTKTEEKRYMQYVEIATEGVALGSVRVPPVLALVLAVLGLEVVLANTRLRKVP